jgi:glycerophosphoryl diester phosphodiesterase
MSALRKIWEMLTFWMAMPCLILVGIGAVSYGSVECLATRRAWYVTVRLRVVGTLLRVYGKWAAGATWLFQRLSGTREQDVPAHARARQELLVVGHRGSPIAHCENTLASFSAAIAEGANALELDLCLTQDGEVVVWHDWDPDTDIAILRETGCEPLQRCKPRFGVGAFRRPVTRLTLAELRTHCGYVERESGAVLPAGEGHILTWREFLEAAKAWPSLRMVLLDIKLPPSDLHLAESMMAQIQTDLSAVRPTFECVGMTIYPEVLAVFKAVAPQFRYCLDRQFGPFFHSTDPRDIAARSAMRDALWLRHDFASVGRPMFMAMAPWEFYQAVLSHELALRSQARRKPWLITWTINDPEEMRWLIQSGVDAILTDLPAQLVHLERQRKAIAQFQAQTQQPRDAASTGS